MAEQIAGAGLPANVAEILAAEELVGLETPIENGHLVKAPTLECLVERHRARLSIHEGGASGPILEILLPLPALDPKPSIECAQCGQQADRACVVSDEPYTRIRMLLRFRDQLIYACSACGRENSANDNGHARIIGSIEDWLYDRIDVDGEGVVLRSADDLRAFLSLTR